MTLDPQLTIVRTREVGPDFYDQIIAKVQSSIRRPAGMMFHFSGTYADEFFSVSAYTDKQSTSDMFTESTGPDFAEIVRETGGGPDLSRDEFEIFSFAVHADDELQGFRFTDPGEFVAVLVTNPDITPERYALTTAAADFPDKWPEGLVIHVAGMFGNHMGVFDVWHGDANMGAFYVDRLAPAIHKLTPEVTTSIDQNPSAIELHSLYINRGSFEGTPEYRRAEPS